MLPSNEIKPRGYDSIFLNEQADHLEAEGFVVTAREMRRTAIAVKRMAVELEAWRSGRLHRVNTVQRHDEIETVVKYEVIGLGVEREMKWFDTIEAAVDALMAEREE